MAFRYTNSVQPDVRDTQEVLLGDLNPSYLSDQKVGAENTAPRNSAPLAMKGTRGKNSALDGSSDYSIGTPVESHKDRINAQRVFVCLAWHRRLVFVPITFVHFNCANQT